MINKEDKYRNELFELFKSDLEIISDDEQILKLIEDVFLADVEDINIEEILNKLTIK